MLSLTYFLIMALSEWVMVVLLCFDVDQPADKVTRTGGFTLAAGIICNYRSSVLHVSMDDGANLSIYEFIKRLKVESK